MRKTAATRKLERDLETARAMYDALNEKLDAEYVRGNALSRDLEVAAERHGRMNIMLRNADKNLSRALRRLSECAEHFETLGRGATARAIFRDVADMNPPVTNAADKG
jgi:chromosome segregation ATPase